MKIETYMAMDVHHTHTVIEAQTPGGRIIIHRDVPTEPCYLIEAVKLGRGRKGVVIEEGPMADWVMRVIKPYCSEVIICDPYRNRLICGDDEDKNDHLDPGNLLILYRTGQLRMVHHPERQSMMDLRRWVWLYCDQVELVTAAKNKIKADYREEGIQYGEHDVYSPKGRVVWLSQLPQRKMVRDRLELLYANLDTLQSQRISLNKNICRMARRHPVAKRFLAIPGYREIRSMIFLVMVDTPFRFATARKLWRYGGLGLREKQSTNLENRKLERTKRYNRRLKGVAKGAMEAALYLAGDNSFKTVYERLLQRGLSVSLARLTIARKMLSVPWSMWKSGSDYNPALVGEC